MLQIQMLWEALPNPPPRPHPDTNGANLLESARGKSQYVEYLYKISI